MIHDINWLKSRIKAGDYKFSKHADDERQEENLFISEVIEAILNGRMLEKYADTGRGKSCLIAGFTEDGKPVHIVCGESQGKAVLVTVYIPKPPKFKNVFERGNK